MPALLCLDPQALLHELRSGQRYMLEGDASRAAAQQGPTSLEELVGGWRLCTDGMHDGVWGADTMGQPVTQITAAVTPCTACIHGMPDMWCWMQPCRDMVSHSAAMSDGTMTITCLVLTCVMVVAAGGNGRGAGAA